MKKILLVLLLFPLTISAVPIDKPVTRFVWQHDGQNVDRFEIECNGERVLSVDAAARSALIADAGMSDGDKTCRVFAVNEYTEAGSVDSVDFFLWNGQPYVTIGDLAAPVNIGVE